MYFIQLVSYHTERAFHEQAEREEEERRLSERRAGMKAQARRGKERCVCGQVHVVWDGKQLFVSRVRYREECHALRLAEQRKAEERAAQEEREREGRLQQLRETVRLCVECWGRHLSVSGGSVCQINGTAIFTACE